MSSDIEAIFRQIFITDAQEYYEKFRRFYFRPNKPKKCFSRCFEAGNKAQMCVNTKGRENIECAFRYIHYGLCVARECGHKFVHSCADDCIKRHFNFPPDVIFDACSDQLNDLFAVLEEESEKFEQNLSLGVRVIREQCARETFEADEAFRKYGPKDERSMEAELKQHICVVPKVCPSEYHNLEKCWKKKGFLALCQDRVDYLLKCAFKEIYQPVYDISTSQHKEPDKF
jgi:hypothetical protein